MRAQKKTETSILQTNRLVASFKKNPEAMDFVGEKREANISDA